MKLSIVIPTYNQAKILSRVLDSLKISLQKANIIDDTEIVLVNDGSTDETDIVVKKYLERQNEKYQDQGGIGRSLNIKYFQQENKGPAAARNLAIKNAQGKIILLIGDDVIADENLIKEHLRFHQKYPDGNICVAGFTTWARDIKVTPFMYWLQRGGPQFRYDRAKGKLEVDFLLFYTSNASLKKSFFEKHGLFDEDFHVSGATAYEDTELGLRFAKQGLRFFYNPKAIGYHHHPKTLKQVCQRRFYEGQVINIFWQKHPDIEKYFYDKLKYWLSILVVNNLTISLLEPLALFFENKLNITPLFWLVCRHYYNRGMRSYGKMKN